LQSHKKRVVEVVEVVSEPRHIRAKKAKRAPLLYTGVYRHGRNGNKFMTTLPLRFHLGEKNLGVFDTQQQAAEAIAAEVGYAAGGGLHLT
jgi:hypothetical protein